MDMNDDDPEDVKRAVSIEKEINKGKRDDKFEGYPRFEKNKERWLRCAKPLAKKKAQKSMAESECCDRRKVSAAAMKEKKQVKVMIYGKPCIFPKLDIIPRHCLSKKEYIDVLATPNRRCPPACLQEAVIRKLKPVSQRIKELARPPKHRMLITLQEGASRLKPEFVDNLIKSLEGETCLTPEQAAKAFRNKKRQRISQRRKKERKFNRSTRKSKKSGTLSATILDKDAVTCQYMMAERFVKSILDWRCPIPKEEYEDIANVIIKRLSYALEYTPLDESDRKSQQMRFLSDVVACWISGVLFEVAEDRKMELEQLCEKKRKEEEEEEEDEEEEEEEEEDKEEKEEEEEQEDEDDQDEDEEEDEEEDEGEEEKEEEGTDKEAQERVQQEERRKMEEEEERMRKEEEAILESERKEEQEERERIEEEEDEKRRKKVEEEEKAKRETKLRKSIVTVGDYGDFFSTDLPFVTFRKLIDVLYAMLESMPESKGVDLIRDRIQAAIYDKFRTVIEEEDPEALNEHMKDVLIVLAGKIANWMKNILTESQIIFLDKYPAEVESIEIRDWSKWLTYVSDTADNWGTWLRKVLEEAEGINEEGITRGDWQDWTKSVDVDALLWRRFHLQTIHQAHRNVTLMAQREVVKTGTKTMDFTEKEIRNADLQIVA
ncbi:glutamic acid-rich protein-like [Polistes fuscatus]|uniref:glutamic acid-rich protein-like n=1 Tax=Polistes fuscatus TaxID=30207 RepID=UPI001CA9D68E|nr:glutamic acid-rich protein-like [Polistes fuscatus]